MFKFNKKITIWNHIISEDSPTFIIWEIWSNHNQDIDIAKEMIDVAVDAWLDAVKFQSLNYDEVYNNIIENQKELFEKIELKENWYKELKNYCDNKNIIFLSAPTYLKSIDLLENLNVSTYKIASPQTKYCLPIVELVSKLNKSVFLSTWYCYQKDIENAVNIFRKNNNPNLLLFHCTSQYPTLAEDSKLWTIKFLKEKFDCLVGFSDHTMWHNITLSAVAAGAKFIEKHFTLDRNMKWPDHSFALIPEELKNMVNAIREFEKSWWIKNDELINRELKLIPWTEYKIISKSKIIKWKKITLNMLDFKRWNWNIFANDYKKVIWTYASKDYNVWDLF